MSAAAGLGTSMRRLLLLVATLLAAAPASAGADVVIDGRGWGHGVGLSQYGAQGYALREGRDFRWILGHYYTGTTVGGGPGGGIRVLLKSATTPKLCGATRVRDASGRRVRLSVTRTYSFAATGSATLRVVDTTNRRTRARLRAPLTVTGAGEICVRGRAENGLSNGEYRGRMVLVRDGTRVMVINHLSLEQYLYGVVPGEMPASWTAEALKAQSVIARSYAIRGRRPGEPFDVYTDVRSQMYVGLAGEAPAATAAVRATQRQVVRYGGEVAQTFFFSTSGGRTAGNEEAFGGAPLPYLRSVDDPYDSISPVHTWTERLTIAQAERRLRDVLDGDLEDLVVTVRTPSGRAATVEVRGSEGTQAVPAGRIRNLLELRSTWFEPTVEP
jgi:stage II sporulation protein D